MTIADRIQSLRKARGISQEELADQIGVSRQAISKWESEQSCPELDKIILLSDYFGVTTDYLLKGIETKSNEAYSNEAKSNVPKEKRTTARIYAATGTAINFIGLMGAIRVWLEKQAPSSVTLGFILMALGCFFYALGQITGEDKAVARKWFFVLNIWFLLLMPVSCIYNFVMAKVGGFSWTISPLPKIGIGSHIGYTLCWLCYIAICVGFDLVVVIKDKHSKQHESNA